MNTNLSTRGKREVLWNRLKEISDNGKLAMCKSRKEVGRMVGYTVDREQAGYLWVTSMIKQGKLKETVMGIDKRGYMEYDYKLVENPVKSEDLRTDWGNARVKGKVRFEKLKELAKNGELAKAKTRQDLVKLAGYPEKDYAAGYSWIRGLIKQGHIKETNIVLSDRGMEASYYLTGTEPSYKYESAKVKTNKENTMPNKKLSMKDRGKIKWEKLLEGANGGSLALCKNRREVAELVGYTKGEAHRGHSWVSNLIKQGHLIEKRVGTNHRGFAVCEYSLGTTPDYGPGVVFNTPEPQIIERARMVSDAPSETTIATPNAKVVITYGELKIELNEVSPDMVKDIIADMFNKVKGE